MLTTRRTTALAAAALLTVAATTAARTPAVAAGETCQGKPATLVGTGEKVVGTAGDDVIVSGTAWDVQALAGNDLVCIAGPGTSGKDSMFVGAGEGDDLVDTSAASYTAYASLGPGRDSYVGGAEIDIVHADDFDDQVSLGDGDDVVFAQNWAAGGATGGAYDGGAGGDEIVAESATGALEVDLADGSLRADDVAAATVDGFTDATVAARDAVLKGDGQDQTLRVGGCRMEASGRGGDDLVRYGHSEDFAFKTCSQRARLSGGGGTDTLRGSNGNDVLKGNAGRSDSALGRSGRDRCRAEVEIKCER